MDLKQLNEYCEQSDSSINIKQSNGKPVLSSITNNKTNRTFYL